MVTPAEKFDVVIVGGGPSGLAAAIAAARHDFSTLVLEQRALPPDKACGEGLLPPAVQALERLGALRYIDDSRCRPFRGIRFLQEDGSNTEAPLPGRGGLGVRRTVLVEALGRRAHEVGAHVRYRCPVRRVERTPEAVRIETGDGPISARLLIAADGLHSPIRRAAGLERAPARRRRYALRRHYALRPWSDHVEVYVDDKGEAVVTPVSANSINVNFVWERGEIENPSIDSFTRRLPALWSRIANAEAISPPIGAGPMACRATRRTADRLVLLGDAAGFIDSISADGLSIAFNSALLLGACLPEILAADASRESLAPYEREASRLFRSYWIVTNGLLWIARHQTIRRALIHRLQRHPRVCRAMMDGAIKLMLSAVPA